MRRHPPLRSALRLEVVPGLLPCAVVLALACTGGAEHGRPPATTAVPVELATARPAGTADPVIATGRYAARDEVPLAFKTGGIVARVLVDEGDVVRQGQLLAALDLREIEALVAAARAGVEKAQRDHDRLQRLLDDSVATRAQVQDAATALEAARAGLAQAQVNRDYSVITAPEPGVVQQRLLAPGALAAPGQPVLQVGGARRGAVLRVGLADREAVRVRPGDAATVRFVALEGTTLSGTVTLVGRSADPRTGTYLVEVALVGAASLPLGLVGEARIAPRAGAVGGRRGVAVPMTALLEPDGDSATVLLLATARDSLPQPRRVRLLGTAGDEALLDDLAPGTLVVARGAAYVTPGSAVRVVAPVPAGNAPQEPRP